MEDCFELKLPPERLQGLSVIALAHVGDAVMELLVRGRLCSRETSTGRGLHRRCVAIVRAEHQALCARRVLPILREEEAAVYRRGRNARVHSVPAHASRAQYAAATGLEALLGWLYLTGQRERLGALFDAMMEEPPCP